MSNLSPPLISKYGLSLINHPLNHMMCEYKTSAIIIKTYSHCVAVRETLTQALIRLEVL